MKNRIASFNAISNVFFSSNKYNMRRSGSITYPCDFCKA